MSLGALGRAAAAGAAFAILAGCAQSSPVRSPVTAGSITALPPRAEESSLPREEIEAIPEPGTPGSPVRAGAAAPAPSAGAAVSSPAASSSGGASAAIPQAAGGTLDGYRVQLFASPDRNAADDVAGRARAVLRDAVYVEWQPPLYKVRVGDYLTRDEASKARERALESGYPDAWIAEAMVHRRGAGGH